MGNPNYALTQYNLSLGGTEVSTLPEMENSCWWGKFRNADEAIRAVEELLSMKYVQLEFPLSVYEAMQKQYAFAVSEWDKLNKDFRPNIFVEQLKQMGLKDKDRECELMYEIKSSVGEAPGYSSYHNGLHYYNLKKLFHFPFVSFMPIAIAGIGPGDFVRYSLPDCIKKQLIGIDLSRMMLELAMSKGRVERVVKGNVSHLSTWNEVGVCSHIIADYFLDITAKPVDVIRYMANALCTGGELMITVLPPIDQVGPDSKKVTNMNDAKVSVEDDQNIGNTGNPWFDLMKIIEVCKTYCLVPKRFSITSYVQYDCGRIGDQLPLEVRPSAILVFEKCIPDGSNSH